MFGSRGEFGTPAAFEITQIDRAPNGDVALTWTSKSNATYALEVSTALAETGQLDGWSELDDGIESAGSETEYVVESAVYPILTTEPILFFRVREVE